MSKQIEIIVAKRTKANPKGGITLEAHGYVGQGCEAAVRHYAEKLGEVKSGEHKAEYFQQEDQTQEQSQ